MKFVVKSKAVAATILSIGLLLTSNVSVFAAENSIVPSVNSSKIETSSDYDKIITSRGNILTYEDFAAIKVELDKIGDKATNESAKKLIVSKIIEKEKAAAGTITPSYTIWGSNLNETELILVAMYPFDAVNVYNDAQAALSQAQYLYQASTLYQGNGDAFRHSYWNALMYHDVGPLLAEGFATAHESTSPEGIDKSMDLFNNNVGRNIGRYYSRSDSFTQCIIYVSNGWLERIVNGKIVVTDSSGRN